jgi:RND superfamily putative drug exporter
VGANPLQIPLLIFCITFGLSMDYEVMILSRVREEFLKSRDASHSIREGLAATAGLISGAAAIMVAVFGAFCYADLVLDKMLGLGLAVAVAVDALVVRSILVPAAMRLAGRWNWYPGLKES